MPASGLTESLFSWLNGLFSWLVSQGMSGRLQWLADYWPLLVLIIGIVCVAADLAVWLIRYRIDGVRGWSNSGLVGLARKGIVALWRMTAGRKRSSPAALRTRPEEEGAVPRPAARLRDNPPAEPRSRVVDVVDLSQGPSKPRRVATPRPLPGDAGAATRPVASKDPDEAPTRQ